MLEFGDDIQIHHEKCIEIYTNMPSIGLEIREIVFYLFLVLESRKVFAWPN